LFQVLVLYKRQWNHYTGNYEGPEHKTESHYADAVRYMSDAVLQFFNEKTGAFLINTKPVNTVAAWIPDNEVSWDF
jgi:hypothetical protein